MSIAHIAGPSPLVNESDEWIDVRSAGPAPNYCSILNDWHLLQNLSIKIHN